MQASEGGLIIRSAQVWVDPNLQIRGQFGRISHPQFANALPCEQARTFNTSYSRSKVQERGIGKAPDILESMSGSLDYNLASMSGADEDTQHSLQGICYGNCAHPEKKALPISSLSTRSGTLMSSLLPASWILITRAA